MKRQLTWRLRFSTLALAALLTCSAGFSESRNWKLLDPPSTTRPDQKGEFVAAFEWSVNRSHDYTWPFESIRAAPYESVWMVVEKMPRAWPEKRGDKYSAPLSVYCCLQVNGNRLPKPQRVADSQTEFRVSLEHGRLRLSFSLPPGFRLDSRYSSFALNCTGEHQPRAALEKTLAMFNRRRYAAADADSSLFFLSLFVIARRLIQEELDA